MADKDFTIKVTMRERWIPYFIGMLKQMELNGQMGRSRMIKFYSDGDGDFRPTFKFDIETEPPLITVEDNGDMIFDAG